MIKIIKEGKIEEPPIYRSTCERCGCEFEFALEDAEQEFSMSGFASYVFLPCPYCGKMVYNYGEPINAKKDEADRNL